MLDCDVIVIGSGPAGAHAAYPLVEAGKSVMMIDGGNKSSVTDQPTKNFEDVRSDNPEQWRFFLGEDVSGIPINGLTGGLGGGQVSGNRSYVIRDADRLLPLVTENCQLIQSLANGGLGAAWGAACAYMNRDELIAMGLPPDDMEKQYDIITKRIGISGPPGRAGIQPLLKLDHHAEHALARYRGRKNWFKNHAMTVMQPHSAILTEPKDDRQATAYNDMDYWSNDGKSVYRPQYTIDVLRQKPNFRYVPGFVVRYIKNSGNECIVHTENMKDGHTESFSAKKVIVAAGAIGTARILLRSLDMYNIPVPFIGKPHVFSACLQSSTLGKRGPKQRTSLCQLLVIDEQKRHGLDSACAQLYSYRSLQLFRLIASIPLPTPQALSIASLLSPALVIADIRFPGLPSAENTAMLTCIGNKEHMHVSMKLGNDERQSRNAAWQRIRKTLWKLGMMPVKNMWLPEASSSHYAGTIPVQSAGNTSPLQTDLDGKVHAMQNVHVADASVFRCLPAKPHTLTIMANANRIGEMLINQLS